MCGSIRSRVTHRHERPAPHELGRIRIRLGTVLLGTSTKHFGEIQVAVRIGGYLMRGPRIPWPRAELSERELHVTREIELDDAIGEAVHRPHVLVGAHQHAVRRDARPLLEELAVGIEHLDAAVAAIGYEYARRRSADRDPMRRVELSRAGASAAPLQ